MNSKLDPTRGYVVAGVALDDNRFLGKMVFAQLMAIAKDPRLTEDQKIYSGNPALEKLRAIRIEVQRLFSGAKEKNVESYAKYVVGLRGGANGMTPPIILYTTNRLEVAEVEGTGTAQTLVPYGEMLVAIDGETQLAARFEAANMSHETQQDYVAVVICHGKPLEWARQVFHDLNVLGVSPNAALSLSMDERDPCTHVARSVENAVPFFSGRVNKVRRQLGKKDREVVTLTALRGACVTLAKGIGGIQYGAKPVHVESDLVSDVEKVAVEWFSALADLLGAAMEDRSRTIAGSATVMAALGAMGHELVAITDQQLRERRRAHLLQKLRTVQWDQGECWEGIAGKWTPKGRFSVGGPKETAYAVYSALADETSASYAKVRVGQQRDSVRHAEANG